MAKLNDLLCKTVQTSHTDMTITLLAKGVDVNCTGSDLKTPMYNALLHNQQSQVILLIQNGAKMTEKQLFQCIDDNRIAIIMEYIAINKQDIDMCSLQDGTLLYHACLERKYDIAKFLLSNGADCNKPKHNGVTSLRIACALGSTDIAKLLLDAGADPNIQGNDGSTALIRAMDNDHTSTVELLLSCADINVNLQTYDGMTALMHAAKMGKCQIVIRLIGCGADITLKNKEGKTARDMSLVEWLTKPKPVRIALAICLNNFTYTVVSLKNVTLQCEVWNDSNKKWASPVDVSFDGLEIEIANEKMQYHALSDVGYIRFSCVTMLDGLIKNKANLYC